MFENGRFTRLYVKYPLNDLCRSSLKYIGEINLLVVYIENEAGCIWKKFHRCNFALLARAKWLGNGNFFKHKIWWTCQFDKVVPGAGAVVGPICALHGSFTGTLHVVERGGGGGGGGGGGPKLPPPPPPPRRPPSAYIVCTRTAQLQGWGTGRGRWGEGGCCPNLRSRCNSGVGAGYLLHPLKSFHLVSNLGRV